MRSKFKDAGHLVLLALVFACGLAVFLILRAAIVPPSFGVYGHYRAAALEETRLHPIAFAGQSTCASCHVDEAATKSKGKHLTVKCEACHGALAAHAEDPVSVKPQLPDVKILCARCHEADAAKPKSFPQVVTKEHSGGELCTTCHQPHSPGF